MEWCDYKKGEINVKNCNNCEKRFKNENKKGGQALDIKDLLMQYKDLQQEIKDLERRIKKLENYKVERDKVRGSSSEFPYTLRSFTIEGYNIREIDRVNRLKNLLVKRKSKCEDMKIQIEEFISNIPDSRTRRVFQYRYIDNYSWLNIAMKMGKVHESYPRKIHDRYLESLKEKRKV